MYGRKYDHQEAIMARSLTFAAAKLHDGLILTRVAGILALGLSVLLETLAITPFCSSPQALLAPLFFVAVVQIGAGLNAWRHERILESVVMVAFGLFTCSQISQLGSLSATPANSLAQGAFLLFWGIFAARVAAQPSDCGRSFHLLLAAVATTLLLKALVLVLAWSSLWSFPLLAGVITFALAILTGLRHLPALRS
jgi:succinate-acetate transporter protein